MATKPPNTRIATRFRPDGRSVITVGPMNSFTRVTAHLLDVNKFGGLGIFISARTAFDRLPLDSFLEPWIVNRASTKGEINFNVNFFHAIPHVEEGRKGVRVSAILSDKEASGQASKAFMSPRRRAKREPRETFPIILSRLESKIQGRLLNVGDDEGAGIGLERPQLGRITWGDLFQEGWTMGAPGYSLPFFVQRLSMQDGQIVVGGSAPGINRAREYQQAAAKASPAKEGRMIEDDDLMDLLDEILPRKKR